jgi:GNAT superfamily N-acetyltransferase
VLLTRELDESIRRAEIGGIRCAIETARRLWPSVGAQGIEVAGGLAAFTGVESPLSQAYGVGTLGPVSREDVERITEFFQSHNTTPRVFVSPLADATLGQALAAAGCAPSEYQNVLVSDDLDTHARRDERVGVARDLHDWAQASARGFTDREELFPGDADVALLIASSEGVCALEAGERGAIVSTAAMDLRGECSALFAASTLPTFRRRGWHTALIRDRIARARDSGARFVRATARPGSISERNFHRCGFATLYTRTLWELKA